MDRKMLWASLNKVITPRLSNIGLNSHSDYLWLSKSANSTRKVFKYNLLKGNQGTFTWGACFDFIPTVSGNTLKFHRTEKGIVMHLFEWTDEYASSFDGGKLDGGGISHWDANKLGKSIDRLLDKHENKMIDFFAGTSSIEKSITTTEKQIHDQKRYNLHSPDPKYILPFLLARNNQVEEGLLALKELTYLDDDLRTRIEKILKEATI